MRLYAKFFSNAVKWYEHGRWTFGYLELTQCSWWAFQECQSIPCHASSSYRYFDSCLRISVWESIKAAQKHFEIIVTICAILHWFMTITIQIQAHRSAGGCRYCSQVLWKYCICLCCTTCRVLSTCMQVKWYAQALLRCLGAPSRCHVDSCHSTSMCNCICLNSKNKAHGSVLVLIKRISRTLDQCTLFHTCIHYSMLF